MTINKQIPRWQLRIFLACFIAYTAAYICRVNISVAIPGIQESLGFSSTNLGMVGTSFFWLYAVGQLINGFVGDKISSRLFIFFGLMVSVGVNILFGFSSSLLVMMLLWGANGIFQSMLWGPIVKTLSYWFPVRKHNLVTFGMSFSLIVGYLVAWGIAGSVMEKLNWRWTFWLPAAIVFFLSIVWFSLARNKPQDVGLPDVHALNVGETPSMETLRENAKLQKIPVWNLITKTGLPFIAFAGLVQGIIKDSISLWSPKLLMETQDLSLKSTIAIVLIIPLINLLGIFLAGWLNRLLKYNEKLTLLILMSGGIVASFALLFFIQISIAVSILLIACASAFMFGANPIMTTTIPLQYLKYGRVSAIAGFIDFSIYVGSGLSGVFTGLMADFFGWNSVFYLWGAAAVLGAISIGIKILKDRKLDQRSLSA